MEIQTLKDLKQKIGTKKRITLIKTVFSKKWASAHLLHEFFNFNKFCKTGVQ